MNPDGPYVAVAAICELVLNEKDNRVSCIRFFDVFNVTVHDTQPEKPTGVRIQVNAFVSFKSGGFVGTKNCMLRLVGPSGAQGTLEKDSPKSYPMVFKGGEHGHNLVVTLDVPATESGLYWFDVTLDDEVYTRMPLRINLTWQSSPLLDQADSEDS